MPASIRRRAFPLTSKEPGIAKMSGLFQVSLVVAVAAPDDDDLLVMMTAPVTIMVAMLDDDGFGVGRGDRRRDADHGKGGKSENKFLHVLNPPDKRICAWSNKSAAADPFHEWLFSFAATGVFGMSP